MKRADLPPALQARVALMRFGLGPRADLPASFWTKPNEAFEQCMAELDTPGMASIDTTAPEFSTLLDELQARPLAGGATGDGVNFRRELRARYRKHLQPTVGFVERLALFWMNYFNIYHHSCSTVLAMIGVTERNIIRANTLGKFEDMLLGISQSAAMLTYLDGRNSTARNTNQNFAREILELHTLGSNAAPPSLRQRGVIQANYTQTDVEELAKILTGWGVRHDAHDDPLLVPPGEHVWQKGPGRTFTFNKALHAAGARSVNVGGYGSPGPKSYAEMGVTTGLNVLVDLARSPQTARHAALRMLSHFVASNPLDSSVDAVAKAFMDTGGDLKETARAMLKLDEVWTMPLTRLRLPYPWFISMLRAIDLPAGALANVYGSGCTFQDQIDNVNGCLRVLGHQPWLWPTPDGYPDRESFWENGNALRLRAGLAYNFLNFLKIRKFPLGTGSKRIAAVPGTSTEGPIQLTTVEAIVPCTETYSWQEPKAPDVLAKALGNYCPDELRRQVASLAAVDNTAALALLFSSPQFILR